MILYTVIYSIVLVTINEINYSKLENKLSVFCQKDLQCFKLNTIINYIFDTNNCLRLNLEYM